MPGNIPRDAITQAHLHIVQQAALLYSCLVLQTLGISVCLDGI